MKNLQQNEFKGYSYYDRYVVAVVNFMEDSRKVDKLFTVLMIGVNIIGWTAVTFFLLNQYYPSGWH